MKQSGKIKRIVQALTLTVAVVMGISNDVESQMVDTTFQTLIRQYEQSIDKADTTLAKNFWSQRDEVSFINPRSTEYGWGGIKNIYKMFADKFTDRKLHGFNEKVILYNNVAWLTFEWVFDARFKANNQAIQTKGRETQIWHRDDGFWKLVHVHYSGLPVNGDTQGF